MAALPLDPPYLKRLGERIRNLRLKSGITQKQAATIAGVAEHTLRRWEQGSHAPKLWNVEKLAGALGCPVAALLSDTPGSRVIAEVVVSAETLRSIRAGGHARSAEVAERLAASLEPLLFSASRDALPTLPGSRARPRRSREAVLAGTTQADEMRRAALLRHAQSSGAIQAGGGDEPEAPIHSE